MYKFSKNKSGQFILKNKGVSLIVTPDGEYTHCDIKVEQMEPNKYSGFSSRPKHEIVKSTIKDFVYLRKESKFLSEMHEYMSGGGIVHFDGEEVPGEALLVPIGSLDLSTRPHNALERNKIYTIDDIPRDKKSLKKLDGMGEKSANEILAKLKEIGLLSDKKKPKPKLKKKTKDLRRDIQEGLDSPSKPWDPNTFLEEARSRKPSASKKTKLSDTEIPDYILDILEDNGIIYLEDLPKTIIGLLKIEGLGRARIKKLVESAPIDFSTR